MSDNSSLPTGDVIGADDIGGIKYQRVKVIFGIDGVNEGDVASNNALPVAIKNIPGVTVQGTATVNPQGRSVWRVSFARNLPTTVDTAFFQVVCNQTGMTFGQTGGNLVLQAGTTPCSETIIRSSLSFAGSLRALWQSMLSQRIVNQQFFIELVDVIGDALPYNIDSTTQVTVTFPAGTNPFTTDNTGQSMTLGAITDPAAPGGRFAIAAVAGDTVSFTVAGFPAAGTGTLSLFGWNYHRVEYSTVTATQAFFGTGRSGWANANATVSTVTSATGHIAHLMTDDEVSSFADQNLLSFAAPAVLHRGGWVTNVPDPVTSLRMQIRMLNGPVAPATNTTWTLGMVGVSTASLINVAVESLRPNPPQTNLQVDTELPVAAVLADATVNPTAPQVGAGNMNFNGTTWDRVRGNWNTTTGDTGAKTVTLNGATQTNFNAKGMLVLLNIGTVSGTTPTLNAKLQFSPDSGTTWIDLPGAAWAQIVATGQYGLWVYPGITPAANSAIALPLPRTWRIVYTIAGTTPSFTITNVQVAYLN